MPKVGGRRKKTRTAKQATPQEMKSIPRVFVVQKGHVSSQLHDTVVDMRKCFYPHTSMRLEDKKSMALKSYVKAARYYDVSHLVVLQRSNEKNYFRVLKVGGGQMVFRVVNFCRMRDVMQRGGQPFSFSFKEALLVLSNFSESVQLKMIAKGLQQLFPSFNLEKIKMENVKRVVSFTYVTGKKCIYFRHYKIIMGDAGINSSLVNAKPIDLSSFHALGDYFLAKDNESKVGEVGQSTIKLVEMGPRLKLKFVSYKEDS